MLNFSLKFPWFKIPPPRAMGIDLGASSVRVVVGEARDGGLLAIHGLSSLPLAGVVREKIVDLDAAAESIRRACQVACQAAGYRPSDVALGIGGRYACGAHLAGKVEVRDPESGVSERDCRLAHKKALQIKLPQDLEILHTFIENYTSNDEFISQSPIGLFAHRLGVRLHALLMDKRVIDDYYRCLQKVGLGRLRIVAFDMIANAWATLSPEEREAGALLVNVGAAESDVVVLAGGILAHFNTIALGGDALTKDIAKVMRYSHLDAEVAKKKIGRAISKDFSVNGGDAGPEAATFREQRNQDISRARLNDIIDIIEARVEEIFFDVSRTIARFGLTKPLKAGAILTGNTMLLEGIESIGERMLNLPCRIGRPCNVQGLDDPKDALEYTTAVGLIRWEMENYQGWPRFQGPGLRNPVSKDPPPLPQPEFANNPDQAFINP